LSSAWVKQLLHRGGLDVRRYPNRDFEITLTELIRSKDVDLVVDVGANVGQFGTAMREAGFSGRLVSFEPMSGAFDELERRASADGQWDARRAGAGAEPGELTINVAANSYSSSFLPMESTHIEAAPDSQYVATEAVPVVRLDEALGDTFQRALLKIDTQGYESAVLDGAAGILDRVAVVVVEMSLAPLYVGQPSFHELFGRLGALGFEPWWIQPEFIDPSTRRMLQVNGVFVRTSR
jgi:FkbM family methyltransferase